MEFKLKTGAELLVTPSTFRDANALKKSLLPQLKGLTLDPKSDLSVLAAPIIDALISDDVEESLFKCFEKCVYYPRGKVNASNARKVDMELFDDPELGEQARKDYHEICLYVIRANVECFFESILSWLKTKSLIKTTAFPPLTSTPNMQTPS